jgi:uncharacterized membrane protein
MTRWFVALLVCVAAAGCVSSGDATGTAVSASCSGVTMPASCPTTTPSYKTDVAPVLANYCASCHAAGGEQSDKPLDTYQGASSLVTNMENQIAGCSMPPSSDAQPTAAERETVLAWIVCGAPNN